MTNTNTDIHTDTDTDTDTHVVVVELFDAAELAVICDYVADWLGWAPPAVTASLARFAGADAPAVLLDALARLADSLVRAVASPSPTPVRSLTPLAPGETAGLAGLLVDLAINGWPAEADQADSMAGDCRRWAMRLFSTPGMIE